MQNSGKYKRENAGMQQVSGLRISDEPIYAAIYALPRSELRRELIDYLGSETTGQTIAPEKLSPHTSGGIWRSVCSTRSTAPASG